MRIKVLYFGMAEEIAGRREEQLSLRRPASVEDLLSEVERTHAGLARLRRVIRVAVDEKLVGGDATLKDGETVALLPPVAGG